MPDPDQALAPPTSWLSETPPSGPLSADQARRVRETLGVLGGMVTAPIEAALEAPTAYVEGRRMSPTDADAMARRSGVSAGMLAATGAAPRMMSSLASGAAAADRSALHMFAGPKAKTANLNALKMAQVMEERGATREAIIAATGWFRDAGNNWRFEISDKTMRLKRAGELTPEERAAKEQTLGRVVHHPKLFEAYPQMRESPLRVTNDPLGGSYGAFSPTRGYEINRFGRSAAQLRSTALHEMSHGVEHIEGGQRGGQPGTPEVVARVDRETASQKAMAEAISERLHQELREHIDAQLKAGRPEAEYSSIAKEFWTQNPDKRQIMDAAYDVMLFGERNRNYLLDQGYRRLMGETAARNVQTRRGFSAAEALKKPPWTTEDIPREQQIRREQRDPDQPYLPLRNPNPGVAEDVQASMEPLAPRQNKALTPALPKSATELAPGLKIGEALEQRVPSPARQQYPGIVSTRVPWASGRSAAERAAVEDPHSDILISDYHSFMAHPEFAEKNMAMVRTPFVGPGGVHRYPQFLPGDFSGHTVEDALRFLQFQTDNLRAFGEGFHRHFGDEAVRRGRLWYPGYNRLAQELANKYSMPMESATAAYATRSPQTAWQANVALTDRTAEVYFEHARQPWTSDMHGTLERIYPDFKVSPSGNIVRPKLILGPDGKPIPTGFRQLKDQVIGRRLVDFPVDADPVNLELRSMWIRAFSQTHHPPEYALVIPEGERVGITMNPTGTAPLPIRWSTNDHIANQLQAMDSRGDMRVISDALGGRHKVRNFYNDGYMPTNPFGTVTGDTHYAGGANFLALSGQDMEAVHLMAKPPTHGYSGGWGIYGLSTQAARELGKRWGWRANETQSVTWEGARSVFPVEFKTDANKQMVREIWRNGRAAGATDDQIRQQILNFAETINKAPGGFKRPEWLDVYPTK